MKVSRKYVLSIAGFDPSGGAGILADIKTFEAHRTIGLGVSTSITYQNENEFVGVVWSAEKQITDQVDILLKKYPVGFVKIGLVKDLQMLETLITYILKKSGSTKIIWDPILKASAGFEFHSSINASQLERVLKKIFLITPNWLEATALFPSDNAHRSAQMMAACCNVFLKGGHNEKEKGRDFLFSGSKVYPFRAKKIIEFSKHGSGCVLSSAITANLVKGFKLHRACLKAKVYTAQFLSSNKTGLGYHKM